MSGQTPGPGRVRLYNSEGGWVELAAPENGANETTLTLPSTEGWGTGTSSTAGFQYAGSRSYLSSGSFDRTDAFGDGSNVVARALRVRLVGGGGGGAGSPQTGGSDAHVGASGSGSSFVESVLIGDDVPETATVTVGAGGAGGESGGNGTNGSDTVFGSDLVKAFGGQGGFSQGTVTVTSAYPGVGGRIEGIGDIVVVGGASAAGFVVPGGFCISANGGSSTFGGGAPGLERWGSGGRDGADADGFGAGGSGAVANVNNTSPRNGGDGGPGLAVLDVFV